MDTKSKRLGKLMTAARRANASRLIASRLAASRKRTTSNDSSDGNIQKQDDPIGSGKVTCSSLNVRNGAGTNFDRIGGLTNGKSFQVFEEKDGWLKIQYGSGFGWISKKYTDYKTPEPPKPPYESHQVKVTSDIGLNVRDVPGNGGTPAPGSTVIGGLGYGAVVTVTDEQNGWYKIDYQGKEGWICGDFVTDYDPNSSTDVSTDGVPLFCQGDPRWGSRGLGTGGNTIKSAGCAMCSTAMCLSKIAGRVIQPDELDQYLDTHSGYSGDNIYWAKAASYIGKTATSTSQDKGTIDSNLDSGRPVVICVKGGGHYVCVAGRKSDGTYIIHDPGDGTVRNGAWNGSAIKVDGYTTHWQLVYFH